jgi:hypothetical protein
MVAQRHVEVEGVWSLGKPQPDERVPPRRGVGEAENKVARRVRDGLDDLGAGSGGDGGDGKKVAAAFSFARFGFGGVQDARREGGRERGRELVV